MKEEIISTDNIRHTMYDFLCIPLVSIGALDGVKHSRVCRLGAPSGRYLCAFMKKLEQHSVTKRGGQVWGPQEAITAVRITLNRHTETTTGCTGMHEVTALSAESTAFDK